MTIIQKSPGVSRLNRFSHTLAIALGLCFCDMGSHAEPATTSGSPTFGVFVGTTACTEPIRPLLRIPSEAKSDLIRWKLTLKREAKTGAPAGYQLLCEHESAASPGTRSRKGTQVIQREGSWSTSKGTKSDPNAVVYDLAGAVSLFVVGDDLLHILNPDRSLMIGNGGWSYTLNRGEHLEKEGDREAALAAPSVSYTISPLASGPNVFGAFEGRTPCHGISRALKTAADAGCIKLKWRVTLYQNSETQAPTTYKIEGSRYRSGAREGTWSILPSQDGGGVIYRLEPANSEAALFLREGDDNVLFFLDQDRKPLIGHAEFSYTLNRRTAS